MTSAAVIGAGYWGQKHIEEYTKLGVEVYAVDLKPENLQLCMEKGLVKGTYTDVNDVCKNPDIKYASVCVPNDFHYDVTKALLLSNKNVLVEKPFVMNSEQGTELIELAKQRKLTLTVGHVFRFNNAVNFVRNSLKKGDFGRPYMLKLVWTNLEPVYPERDVIFDLAPHPFDMVEFLFGRNIEEVSCIGQCYRQKHIEVAFINAKLDNILIDIEVSWVTPKKERSLVMVCSEATVFVDCTRQRITIYNNEKAAYQEVDLVPNNTIQDELREFLRCTESRGISIVDAEVGLNTIKVLEKTKLAMESGTVIKVGV